MDVSGNPMGTVHFGLAYGGEDYTLTDVPRYVTEDFKMSRDPHCISEITDEYGDNTNDTSEYYEFPVVPQENLKPSPAISQYENSTNTTNEYDTPKKVVPHKKLYTQQTHEYANWNVIDQQHGEGDQSSVDRKSSNKIPSTSGPGVKEVGKETTAPRKSQAFALDVTMPTKNENVSNMHHLMLPNPVMTGSPLSASPIPPKAKKRSFLPRKVFPEQSVDTEQPPPGPSVTELRKIIEEKYSVN